MARAARSQTAAVRVHKTSVGAGCAAAAAVRPGLGPFLAPFLGCSTTWARWDCRTRSPESCGCPMPSTCRSLRLSGGVWGCLGAGLCSSHGSPQTPAAPPPELSPMYGRWSRWWMPARMVAASTALADHFRCEQGRDDGLDGQRCTQRDSNCVHMQSPRLRVCTTSAPLLQSVQCPSKTTRAVAHSIRTHTALVLAQPAGVVDSCTHRHPSCGTSTRRYQPLEPHPTPFCGRSATHCLCREGELWSVVRVTNSVGFDAKLKAGCSQV